EVRRPHAGLRRGGGSAGTGQQSSLKRSRFYQRDATLEAAAARNRVAWLGGEGSRGRWCGSSSRGVAAGRSAQRGTSGAATGGGGLQAPPNRTRTCRLPKHMQIAQVESLVLRGAHLVRITSDNGLVGL